MAGEGSGMAKFSLYARMIFNSLVRRRSRMIIALLAVAIGAAVLSGLVTVYYDVPRQMEREFRAYGANMVLIPTGNSQVLLEKDLSAAAALLPPEKIVGIAPYLYGTVKVNEQPLMVAGTNFKQVSRVSPYWQVEGQWPGENPAGALIGAEVAERLALEPGQEITLVAADSGAEKKVVVQGIVRTGGAEENFIFVDLSLLQQLLGKAGQVSVAQVSIMAAQEELSSLARRLEEKAPGLTTRLVKRITQPEGIVLAKLRALVYLVTVVVLLLTLICVATTMMAVVTERRKEIGLKKALGAENRSIILEFLGESLTIGGGGGLLGAVLGFLFAQAVGLSVFGRAISFQPLIAPVAILVSIMVSGLACLIPVKMATGVEPAVVLRGE
ncbi:ABC transporter permease [Moorella sp. ACPs]|uniref:ABC transporter permease n=1 Tax=Neomoorella carbonis TaxID=3062783 RepID=UPI00324AB637